MSSSPERATDWPGIQPRRLRRAVAWTIAGACVGLLLLLLITPPRADAAGTGPVCYPSRPALDYRAGGPSHFQPHSGKLIPCRYSTGADAGEPSFGFGRGGRIFYETWDLDGLSNPSGVVRSGRGHATWTDVSPPGPVTSFDPFLLVDPRTKRVFDANFAGNGKFGCSTLSRLGYSGSSVGRWATRDLCGDGFDAESIGVGPPAHSTTTGYPNIVYYCASATLGSAPPASSPVCMKSLNGGATFTPIAPPYPTMGAQDEFAPWAGPPVVGPDGTLYVPKRYGGEPRIAISHNEGRTWTRVQVAHNGDSSEANRAAVDAHGNVYYTWVGANHMPYLTTSSDEGKRWSSPVQLAPPGVRETALARVAVDSASGDAAVVYLGSTNAPGVPPYYAFCQEFLERCNDGAYANATWNGYMTLVDHPLANHPLLRTTTVNAAHKPLFKGGCSPDGGCKAVVDFLDVHFDPRGHPWGAFVDDCARRAAPGAPARLLNPQFGRCEDGTGVGILGELVPPGSIPARPADGLTGASR